MSDRGMKKWNAYKTLEDHMPAVEKPCKTAIKRQNPLFLAKKPMK